jgi:hypothetical protein
MSLLGIDPLSPALSLLGHASTTITGRVAGQLAKAFFEVLVTAEERLVTLLVNDVVANLVRATTAASGAEGNTWFATVKSLWPVAELVVAPLLFAATIGALFRQDTVRLARAWGVGLPVAALGGVAARKLTGFGLSATDALSRAVVGQIAPHIEADLAHVFALGLVTAGAPLGGLVSLVVLAGALLLWLELAVRAVAIEMAVFFMPLALAGVVWPATAHLAKRFVALLGSLLLVKPVVVGALCLGAATVGARPPGAGSLLSGTAILLIAAFAPLLLLKMVPLVDAPSVAHLYDLSRQPVRWAERAAQGVLALSASASALLAPPTSGTGADGLGSAAALLGQASGSAGPARSEEHPLGPARPPAPRPAGGPGTPGAPGGGGVGG